ncbi:alpha/beta hydrolase family protein [Amycolatopsis sp. MtRt-6]|uniref:alpha/beta hydrolase n=1 Tax=Amycolatopsis sp. MtRt-6 TaxID=2792782 RepID=UPI001A8D2E57|nr:alpha/beta hydrolase family protein [Amycolatopsis sp. MtRt-6]
MPRSVEDRQTQTRAAEPPPARVSRRKFVLGAAAGLSALAVARPWTANAASVADSGARVIAERRLSPTMLDLTVDSPALAATAMVRLLHPADWTPGSARTWPVLYLLHGAGDDYTSWTRSTDVATFTRGAEMLVVMPSGGRDGFYSDWYNRGAGGPPRWETFHLTELRQILERGYGAGPVRSIAGLSMGGLGALAYAGRHPGMFAAAASYSGVVHTRYQGARGPSLIQGVLVKDGYDPTALWGDPNLNADVWAAHNPYDLARDLTGIPLYLACGNGTPGVLDPPGTPPDLFIEPLCAEMNTALARRLREVGATVTTDFYGPGTHNWPWWQRSLHLSFPLLTQPLRLGG